jgi:hypothetical protein
MVNTRDSCDRCHELKTRCVPVTADRSACQRCDRLSLLCSYSPPRQTGRPRRHRKGKSQAEAPAKPQQPELDMSAVEASTMSHQQQHHQHAHHQQQQQQQIQQQCSPQSTTMEKAGHEGLRDSAIGTPSSSGIDMHHNFLDESDLFTLGERMFDMDLPMNANDLFHNGTAMFPYPTDPSSAAVAAGNQFFPTATTTSTTTTSSSVSGVQVGAYQDALTLAPNQVQFQLDLVSLQSTLLHVAKSMSEHGELFPHLEKVFSAGERLISLYESEADDANGDKATGNHQASSFLLSVCYLTMTDVLREVIYRLQAESSCHETHILRDSDCNITVGAAQIPMTRRVAAEVYLPLSTHLLERLTGAGQSFSTFDNTAWGIGKPFSHPHVM